ncbi:hypothetical protein OG21DRAFT_1509834 [Imleria badia]|nr:hypothetical protein OG21DRAFT_1509834 [Imleria badia]
MSSSSQADISTKNVTHAMRDESDQNRYLVMITVPSSILMSTPIRNVGSISGASGSDRPRKSKKRRTSPADKQSSRVTTTEAYVHKKRRV